MLYIVAKFEGILENHWSVMADLILDFMQIKLWAMHLIRVRLLLRSN